MDTKKNFKLLVLAVIGVFLLYCAPAIAAENNEVSELKAQVKALQQRVGQLETEKANQTKNQKNNFQDNFGSGWNPFEEINSMQERMNHMMQNSFGRANGAQGVFRSSMSFDPDFNLNETKDGYEIKFDMKGLDKDKVDIQINENSITVKGEQSKQNTEQEKNSYFNSQSFGSFMKTIPLPSDADTSKVKTEKQGDTLVITMPKKK